MSDWELEFDELNELAEKSQFKKLKAVLDEKNDCVYKSLSNIAGVKIAYVNTLNVYDILNCNLFVVARGAAEKMQEVYA